MKKRSFFERLAGNLRFDDSDDDLEEQAEPVAPPKRDERRAAPVAQKQPDVAPERTDRAYERGTAQSTIQVQSDDSYHTIEKSAPAQIAHQEEVGELPVDVYETPNEIIVQTLIAGVMIENISLSVTRDTVTISGKREENKAIPDDAYHIRELYWGAFARSVQLPSEVEIDSVEAIERHGMLMIKMPKIDKRRKTVLKIKSI